MNFFARILSFFRKPKPAQPAVQVLAPVAPPTVPVNPAPNLKVNAALANVPGSAVVFAPPGAYPANDGTGNWRIDRGSFYGTLDDAWMHYRALMDRDGQLDLWKQQFEAAKVQVPTGGFDIRTLTADECEIVAAMPHVFVGLVGPWDAVTKMINWFQLQGGEPTPALAARYSGKDDQFFKYLHWRNDWTSYTGPLRSIIDSWVRRFGNI